MEAYLKKFDEPPEDKKVAAFTLKANQKRFKVKPPPRLHLYQIKPRGPSMFQTYYNNSMLPIAINYRNPRECKVIWLVDPAKLDYDIYLPWFFEGLTETTHPFEILMQEGIKTLLLYVGNGIFRILKRLVYLMKDALSTRVQRTVLNVCRILRRICRLTPLTGIGMINYYQTLLCELKPFMSKNLNLGDRIEYSQRFKINIADSIDKTLHVMERCGGEWAYRQIKYVLPTYESTILNY